MKVGVLLPTFQSTPQRALDLAERAEALGLDGVFAYDHLWPIGSPERPALAPLGILARAAELTSRVTLGVLVARVGLVDDRVLVRQFRVLAQLAPGRVIAGLGTGDSKSDPENLAYGIAPRTAASRRGSLSKVAKDLRDSCEVWVGAGATTTNVIAQDLAVTLNFWNVAPTQLIEAAARSTVSWAGNAAENLEQQLEEFDDAAASWAVFAPGIDVERLSQWRQQHPS